MDQPSPRRADSTAQFATRLNNLFDSQCNPTTGQRYTLREVSEATNGVLGVSYISALRRGQIAMPPADRVQLLAEVFGVDISYFFEWIHTPTVRSDEGTSTEEEDLRRVMSDPTIRTIAQRAGRLGPAERELVLQTLEWAERQSRDRENRAMRDERTE